MNKKTVSRRARRRRRNLISVVLAVFCLVSAFAIGSYYKKAIEAGSLAFNESYQQTKADLYPTAKDQFYKAALEQYTTKSDLQSAVITDYAGGKLEVQKVYDTVTTDGRFSDDTDEMLTLEVPCSGIFTTDLQYAEVITDQQRMTVKVRMPRPELTDITIDYEGAKLKDQAGILTGGRSESSELAREYFDEGIIREELISNKLLAEKASEAAEKKIISAVMAANPYEDVTVEVEFIN
ncbi:MAG: DUF4230 domain-containing protein [Oscillospiraceae bacterium]|nr:DUF4230 domain-containing protein [Oscillospiraceae bacterium]